MERIIMRLARWIADTERPTTFDKILAAWTICISLPIGTLLFGWALSSMVQP